MGIPSYFSHIVKSHRNVIKRFDNKTFNVNNLYLDSNSIVYDAVHNYENNHGSINGNKHILTSVNNKIEIFEHNLIADVCKKIEEYLDIIQPSDIVIIAFDGVAPIAKLEQQRNRRYKSWFQNMISKPILERSVSNEHEQIEFTWDTCNITPGTNFMKELRDKVTQYFKNSKHQSLIKNIIVSASDQKGEGEHKICEYIRENSELHRDTNTVIYGLDADLIMLALNHLHISNKIYLFRETPHYIKNIDSTLNPSELYLMDIPVLGGIIKQKMRQDINQHNSPTTNDNNLLFDYILICFLLGNDFMPHFPSINIRTSGIDILLNAYKQVFSSSNDNSQSAFLTDGKKIVWRNLRKFISCLAEQEVNYFNEEMKIRNKWEKNSGYSNKSNKEYQADKMNRLPIKFREKEKYINPGSDGWQSRYYKTLFDIDMELDNESTEKRKQEICLNYLEGLEWTIKYYTTGCADWRWKYKYAYAPLLEDLIRYVPYFDTEFISPLSSRPGSSNNSINELTQLSYVLPRSSLNLLPLALHKNLLEHCDELYGTEYDFEWAFCKYFWESHVIMPHINIENLEAIVEHTIKKTA
jgi:5'-3' exonuclease